MKYEVDRKNEHQSHLVRRAKLDRLHVTECTLSLLLSTVCQRMGHLEWTLEIIPG